MNNTKVAFLLCGKNLAKCKKTKVLAKAFLEKKWI
jgi:hypothetical protein